MILNNSTTFGLYFRRIILWLLINLIHFLSVLTALCIFIISYNYLFSTKIYFHLILGACQVYVTISITSVVGVLERTRMKYLKLNSGRNMPIVGYGTWKVSIK